MIDCVPRVQDVMAQASHPLVEWQESNCLLCGGGRSAVVVEATDVQAGATGLVFAVVQCQACGLCYTNPRPTQDAIGQFYPDRYRPHRAGRAEKRQRWWRRLPLAGKLPCQEHQPLPLHGQGRLLDFGCGGGRFLALMHRAGWQVTGVDASAAAVDTVRRELGVAAFVGSLPHARLADGSFDVITMIHSLEHVHEPLAVLQAAQRLLAPGGKLVVAVPNIDSLAYGWFGPDWFALDLPRHLTHFTPRTLALMIGRAGLRAGPVQMVRHSGWLRSSARLACAQPSAPAWQRWLTTRAAAWAVSWYSYWTGQTDAMMVTAVKSHSPAAAQANP
jgi:2-polyprenyl-3-methyl-5-hydroxy-6-metoxy-1,4-benzoquinol methylase